LNNQFSLFDLLITIGIIQGVITGILLLTTKKNVRSNRFLGLAILSFAFLSTKPLLHTLDLWDTQAFRFFPNGIELALPPLIYFYVVSLINPKFSFKGKDWLHFVPFFIAQIYAFVVYFRALQTSDFNEKNNIAESLGFDYVKKWDEYILVIALVCYIFYGYKALRNYKVWLDNTTSDSMYPDFKFLRNILELTAIVGVFLVVNHTLDILFEFRNITVLHWHLINLFITFLIYYLGIKAYMQPNYAAIENELPAKDHSAAVAPTTAKFTETIGKLETAMEEDRLFLNPKLSIYELSIKLEVSQKSVSQAINNHFNMSFRDFINSYRLEEVKAKLKDTGYSHMSILGIALECGFNSEASFYRIFKKNTGISPKEFMSQYTSE
jgi:AraC-like DNA-binding protein